MTLILKDSKRGSGSRELSPAEVNEISRIRGLGICRQRGNAFTRGALQPRGPAWYKLIAWDRTSKVRFMVKTSDVMSDAMKRRQRQKELAPEVRRSRPPTSGWPTRTNCVCRSPKVVQRETGYSRRKAVIGWMLKARRAGM